MVEKLMNDLKEAMKNKDALRLSVIREAKGNLKLAEIDQKKEINDELLIDVVSKAVKTRKESINDFIKGNRQDLVDKTNDEIKILEEYLPEQLSEEEITTIIEEAFKELNPSGVKDMGKIMGFVNPKVKGKADMSFVSKLIKDKLN